MRYILRMGNQSRTFVVSAHSVPIIIAFSLIDQTSFEKLGTWFDDFEDKVEVGNAVRVLAGTKSDMDTEREIPV